MEQKMKIDISVWAIVKIVLAIGICWAIFLLKDILVYLLAILIVAAALRPTVNSWAKVIGRKSAVFAVVAIFAAVIFTAGYLLFPPLIQETIQFVNAIPFLIDKYAYLLTKIPYLDSGISQLTQNLGVATSQVVTVAISLVSGIFALLMSLVLVVYFLLEEKIVVHMVENFAPRGKKDQVSDLVNKITEKIGAWLRGEFLLMVIIGVSVYIFLRIMNVPYALPIAVISGLLEVIPTLGPIFSGIIASVVALSVSPLIALVTVIFYVVLQQLENVVIVPKIMQKAVGLPPVIIIIAIIIAARLFGITGALFAIPATAAGSILYKEWINTKAKPNE
ncbi:MAG: AI-2E family transporter [Candidatus Berkelbacteria bacterium]